MTIFNRDSCLAVDPTFRGWFTFIRFIFALQQVTQWQTVIRHQLGNKTGPWFLHDGFEAKS